MVANANSGVIFSLLPANVLQLSLSMYTIEHVSFFFNDFNHHYQLICEIIVFLLVFSLNLNQALSEWTLCACVPVCFGHFYSVILQI